MAIETSVEARASDVYCGDQTKGSKWSFLSLKSGNEIKKEGEKKCILITWQERSDSEIYQAVE